MRYIARPLYNGGVLVDTERTRTAEFGSLENATLAAGFYNDGESLGMVWTTDQGDEVD